MLDTIIQETADRVSYNQAELSNIASSSNHLREIVGGEADFGESFLGGSYRRHTMVKGISDIDLYLRYNGSGIPQTALHRLKDCLIKSYPRTRIGQDKPCILVDFNRIAFDITPFMKDYMGKLSIPNKTLQRWELINFGSLEQAIINLRARNSKLIDLIKVLKLWNRNYHRGLKNYMIETQVCNQFIYTSANSLADWLYSYFSNNGHHNEVNKFKSIMLNSTLSGAELKSRWLSFIENR